MGPDHRATDAPRAGPAKTHAEAAEVKRSSSEKCESHQRDDLRSQFDPIMEALFGMDPCKKCGWYTCECKAKPKRLKKGTK